MSFDKRGNKESVELTPQSHPERLLMLGGAWLAMVTMGIMGMSALVNPQKRLPLIDPLLEAIAEMKQQEHIFAPAPEDEKADKTIDALSAVIIGQGYFAEPAESSADVISLANGKSDAATVVDEMQGSGTEEIAKEPSPVPTVVDAVPKNDVPTWIYLAIASSCIAGSSVITVFLYKLTSPRRHALPSARKLTRRSIEQKKVASTPSLKIPVVEVPPVTPLKISTPQRVQPPTLKIEPVVDPQPAERPKRSRADYLAQLARNAKEQRPKRLVDVMDVRRRNNLAPFS